MPPASAAATSAVKGTGAPSILAPWQRRRVVILTEATGGGVGRHVLDLAESLPAYDLDVLLVHGTRRVADGFGERVGRAGAFGYRAVGLDLHRAPGLHDVAALAAVRKVVRRFRADVLHGHSSKGGFLTRIAGQGVARRIVYTPHAFFTQNPLLGRGSRMVYGMAERALAFGVDRIVTVSSEETAHAVSLGIPRRKLVQIENGIEPWDATEVARRRDQTRRALGIAPHEIVVGFLGRLVEQKDPGLALNVFRRLFVGGSPIRFVLSGDGPLAGEVRGLLDSLGLAQTVQWLPHARGPEIIPGLDVFLMTSRYEGFPYVLLEALSAGCAIVTTDVGGAADCVRDGRNGRIVADATPDALALAVREVTRSPTQLAAWRAASRELSTRFSIDRMVRRTVDLYGSFHVDC